MTHRTTVDQVSPFQEVHPSPPSETQQPRQSSHPYPAPPSRHSAFSPSPPSSHRGRSSPLGYISVSDQRIRCVQRTFNFLQVELARAVRLGFGRSLRFAIMILALRHLSSVPTAEDILGDPEGLALPAGVYSDPSVCGPFIMTDI